MPHRCVCTREATNAPVAAGVAEARAANPSLLAGSARVRVTRSSIERA